MSAPGSAWEGLGRRLRLAVLGGGPGSFIGPIHRAAARLDDRFEIIAGVLSSDPARGAEGARALGIRHYADFAALIEAEPTLDAVAIMTPNDRHHAECIAAIDAGLHVICDKPLANSVAEAAETVAAAKARTVVWRKQYLRVIDSNKWANAVNNFNPWTNQIQHY